MSHDGLMTTHNIDVGRLGEQAALQEYKKLGYVLLAQNWHGDSGELDLIMGLGNTVVFCEVKYRATDRFGSPASAVGWRKQAKVKRVALEWLEHGQRGHVDIRFDVACVTPAGVDIIPACF